MHKPADLAYFEMLYGEYGVFLAKTQERLDTGLDPPAAHFATLSWVARSLGCVCVVLHKKDEEGIGYFDRSVRFSRRMLHAGAGQQAPLFDADLVLPPLTFPKGEYREAMPLPREYKLDLVDYTSALMTTLAFGDFSAIEEVLACPESRYHSEADAPEEVASVRAWRAWILGDDDAAKRESKAALVECDTPALTLGLHAFVAMTRGDAPGFRQYLSERLKAYEHQYANVPQDPDAFVCMQGLALCRLAFNEGLRVPDEPYLPVRLLPNYRSGRPEYEGEGEAPSLWARALRVWKHGSPEE